MTDRPAGSYREQATLLHAWISENLLVEGLLLGPDPGIRFNARIGRFLKSYLPSLFSSEQLVYTQAQSYWTLANWDLYDFAGTEAFAKHARETSERVLDRQTDSGYWEYPNPEWKGRVATVEGCFGALTLIETYRRTRDPRFLTGADNWYRYMIDHIGFSDVGGPDMLSINYFAGWDRAVPNNDTLVLWTIAALADASGSDEYLEYAKPLVSWLVDVQLDSGELPYLIGTGGDPDRPHFLCYQYNAFEFVDLAHYLALTGDGSVVPLMQSLAGYLAGGVTEQGWARYDCYDETIKVPYYTTALGNALRVATTLGFGDFGDLADRCYRTVVGLQAEDGSFPYYSTGNYRLLTDRRSYPRYLSMMLRHLCSEEKRRSSSR